MPDLFDDSSSEKKHVAVAGNIGVGKTALTEVMGTDPNWTPVYEKVDENPYLMDFYNDMRQWAFNLQVFFLSRRFEQLQRIEDLDGSVVQDRSIYEDAQIFARNLYEMDLMSGRDFESYTRLFGIMTSYVSPPTLLVYLRASVPTLVDRIRKRGREYESAIRLEYLERLQDHYEHWIENYDRGPKLIIDTDRLDFVNKEDDRQAVLARIESRLFGLFADE